jgi:hypothetical protein
VAAETWLGGVYFIEWNPTTVRGKRIKIGFTKRDPKSRYRALVDELRRTLVIVGAEPVVDVENELRLLYFEKGTIYDEKAYHLKFESAALGYEWFERGPVLSWLRRTHRV